jgi:hypothetical protein
MIPSYALNKLPYGNIDADEGLMFVTYSSLISGTGKKKGKSGSRFDQLISWCGPDFDGCLLFDECHRAKNFVSGKRSTKTGTAVYNIQLALPKARVVYCSATGVTDPINMGYMSRLGLWGAGTPFPVFDDFLNVVQKAIGMMELAVRHYILAPSPPTPPFAFPPSLPPPPSPPVIIC